MALVRKFGKPDIFLTMTCNPNWEEIKNELKFGQTPQHCPDLVVRVFRAKLEEMKQQLFEKDILGKVKAYTYVVEFQKRGLPHAHFLLIMTGKYKYTCPEQYDRIISAELPNKHKYPELYKLVVKHMMHGPCGALNRYCPCTKNRKSSRTIIQSHLLRLQYKARTPTHYIGDTMMEGTQKSENANWITGGLFLTTLTY
jgi:hypothetical protein